MFKKFKYVLGKLSDRTGKNYTCSEWENYDRHRIYITKNEENQGYIDVINKENWLGVADSDLYFTVEKFLKYYDKNKNTLLRDVKSVLDIIQQKDSNSDAIYTAEKRDNKIVVTKSYWYQQKSGEEVNETVLGEINLDDLSYELPFANKPWLVQYEIFNIAFYVEIISKLYLYEDKNSVENLDW